MPSDEDADAQQEFALVRSIEAFWPSCTLQKCLPANHSLSNTPVKEWPITLLRFIEELAKVSPSRPMHTQARNRVFMIIKELYAVSDSLEDAVRDARDKFITLWPTKDPADLTVNQYYPKPNAIEDFGAWDQPNVNDQSEADEAVFQAYQNAINERGAAFGDRSAGPTISNYTTANRKREWNNPVRAIGELWQSPELPVKNGYGDTAEKAKEIAAIEAHFKMPLSQFLKMESLRPEDAYFIPSSFLHGIVRVTEKFPMVKHDELYKLMVQEKMESRKHCRNANSKTWHSITKANIDNVLRKLQQMYDKTTSQAQTLGNGATSQGFDKRDRSLSPRVSSKKARKIPHTASAGRAIGRNSGIGREQSSASLDERKKQLHEEETRGVLKIQELEKEIDKIKNRNAEIRDELKGLGEEDE